MKKIIITIALVIGLFALAYIYFDKNQRDNQSVELYQAIPNQFPIAFESEDWASFFTKIDTFSYGNFLNEKDWYAGIKTNYQINTSLLDSLGQNDTKKILIALGNNGSSGIGFLTVSAFNLSAEELLSRLAALNFKTKPYNVEGNQIISILNYKEQYDLHIAQKKGLLMLSTEPSFVEGAIIALTKGTALWHQNNESSTDDIRVFIKPKELNFLANYLIKPAYFKRSTFLNKLVGNTILGCSFFNNEIIFSGNGIYQQATLMDTLKHQKSALNSSLAYLPRNVSMYQSISFNDTLFQTEDYAKNSFYEQLNKSYTLFWLNSYDANIDDNRAVVLSVKDEEAMLTNLREIDPDLIVIEEYQNTAIYEAEVGAFINENLMLEGVLAPKVFFTFVENNWIVMKSKVQVYQYLDNYALNNLLNTNEPYLQLRNGVNAKSNLGIYADFKELRPFLTEISLDEDAFSALSKIVVQFSNKAGSIFTQGKIEWFGEQQSVQSRELWRTNLAIPISSKAYEVIDFNTQAREIILQDDSNNVHLLSKTGEELFDVPVNGKIQGAVYQIDYYSNKKLQYLFNTLNSIYIIDRNGKLVDGFPIDLPSKASNSMLMTQYEDNGDIRYFIACDNEKVYGYEMNGKPLTGWSPLKKVGQIDSQIQRVLVKGKDYIYFTNSSGDFYAFNRRGDRRFKKVSTVEGINPFVYSKESFVSGYKGKIYTIDMMGKLTEKEVLDSSFVHCIPMFSPIESTPSFAFANEQNVQWISASSEKLSSFTVEGVIRKLDSLVYKNKLWLLIYTHDSVYMVDELGGLHQDFPIQTTVDVSFIKLIEGKEKLLVYTQDNTVIVKEVNWTNQ